MLNAKFNLRISTKITQEIQKNGETLWCAEVSINNVPEVNLWRETETDAMVAVFEFLNDHGVNVEIRATTV